VSGYVLDRATQSIRPVIGFPGSATLGDPLALGMAVSNAVFFPASDFAVVVPAGGGQTPTLIAALSATPQPVALTGSITDPTDLRFNASGSGVVLYSKTSGQIQIVRGLPGNPSVENALLLGPVGEIQAMALNAAADRVLVSASHRTEAAVYEISSKGAQRIAKALRPAGVAYIDGDADAVFADSALGTITVVRGVGRDNTASTLASGMFRPNALEADGSRLIVTAGHDQVIALDSATGTVLSAQDVPAAVSGLSPLASGSYVLNEGDTGPLYLFLSAEARLQFIPPVAATVAP
jgi:hypothetical protein